MPNTARIFFIWFSIIFSGLFLFSIFRHSADIVLPAMMGLATIAAFIAIIVTFFHKWIFESYNAYEQVANEKLGFAEAQNQIHTVKTLIRFFYAALGKHIIVIFGLIVLYANIIVTKGFATVTSGESRGWGVLYILFCMAISFVFYLGALFQKRLTIPIKLTAVFVTVSVIVLVITGYRTPDYEKNALDQSEIVQGTIVDGGRQYLSKKYNFSLQYPTNWNIVEYLTDRSFYITPQSGEELHSVRLGLTSVRGISFAKFLGLNVMPLNISEDQIQRYIQSYKGTGTINIGGQVYPFLTNTSESINSIKYFFIQHNVLFEATCYIGSTRAITEDQCKRILTSIQSK